MVKKKWSLITQFSSPIIHHLKYIISFGTITQYFSTICGSHTCILYSFYFYFFFSSAHNPNSLNLVRKKKEEGRIEDQTSEKKKKGKKKTEPRRRKKKNKSKVKKCGCGFLHMCLITKILLSYELWKLKTVKMCFQFP